jgi:2,4'-dihydroxyacetophenone dioxygenase
MMAAPRGALSDIVIPSVFGLGKDTNADEDPRVWVPQTDCLDFRPLCFCVSQGYYVNLLRFKGGGVLGCHFHPSPVHALTLKGGWGYKEHDWHADPGTYVFEPPGETHTLMVDEGCEEMITMFHVTGALIYKDPETGQVTGYDDVFTKLEKAREWYKECGLGEDYADQFVR